jgi:hypothetical protein
MDRVWLLARLCAGGTDHVKGRVAGCKDLIAGRGKADRNRPVMPVPPVGLPGGERDRLFLAQLIRERASATEEQS